MTVERENQKEAAWIEEVCGGGQAGIPTAVFAAPTPPGSGLGVELLLAFLPSPSLPGPLG